MRLFACSTRHIEAGQQTNHLTLVSLRWNFEFLFHRWTHEGMPQGVFVFGPLEVAWTQWRNPVLNGGRS